MSGVIYFPKCRDVIKDMETVLKDNGYNNIIIDNITDNTNNKLFILLNSEEKYIGENDSERYIATIEIAYFINKKPLSLFNNIYPEIENIKNILDTLKSKYPLKYVSSDLKLNKGAMVIHLLYQITTSGV